ncbi:hypothetical protein PsYK624_129560 [Phanerochaete sordida]|uniref:Uncharacterized protein n=1 Tax=Phanerochaete sordida TaxID=48140 RepID=A0A9P3GNN3_9APHY|nr:hypothetical protein PsYK624_129560 [Phanerochaete sordida]
MASGFHVLYTIPLWLGGLASSEHPHRLVHMTFQVYANKAISTTPYTWSDNSRLYQPIIVIVGTCSNRQTLSSGFQYSTEWVAHAGRFSSCGTVGISADLFLRGKLLPIVSEINAATTIIPNFSGIKQSQWNLALTTWSEHRDRKDEPPPPPSAVDGSPDEPLKFLWKHHDKLNYEHTSPSQHIADGVYTVTCDTENSLEIPTIYKQGTMAIDLRGKVTLQLDVHLDNHGLPSDWSSKASVEWTASIVVHSEAAGLVVNVSSSPPMFKSLEYTTGTGDHPTLDPEDLLRAVFPPTVDVSDANIEFSRFARVWQSCYPGSSAFTLCNPVFNAKGDLLFELQPYADPTSPTDPDAPPPTFAFSKMPGGRRDPFGVRRGTNRPHRTASRQTGERRPSPARPYEDTHRAGRAGASTPEPHANGAMRPRDSSRFSMSSRSMSPSVPSGTRAPVPRPVVTTTMPASRSQWNITASEEMTPTKAYSTQSSESAYS